MGVSFRASDIDADPKSPRVRPPNDYSRGLDECRFQNGFSSRRRRCRPESPPRRFPWAWTSGSAGDDSWGLGTSGVWVGLRFGINPLESSESVVARGRGTRVRTQS